MIGSDPLVDIFALLSRYDLNVVQLVAVRFNAVVLERMNSVCLRTILSAFLGRCGTSKKYAVVLITPGAEKNVPLTLPSRASARSEGVGLLRACSNSIVGTFHIRSAIPFTTENLDEVTRYGRHVFVNTLSLGVNGLPADVPQEHLLLALGFFGSLKKISFALKNRSTNLQNCLFRIAHKLHVSLSICELVLEIPTGFLVDEESLLQYCFGPCSGNCPACERRLWPYGKP